MDRKSQKDRLTVVVMFTNDDYSECFADTNANEREKRGQPGDHSNAQQRPFLHLYLSRKFHMDENSSTHRKERCRNGEAARPSEHIKSIRP